MEQVRQKLKDQCARSVSDEEDIFDRKEEIRKLNIMEKDLLVNWTTNFNEYSEMVQFWNVGCYLFFKEVQRVKIVKGEFEEKDKEALIDKMVNSDWYVRLMNSHQDGDEPWRLDNSEIQYGGYGEIELEQENSIFGKQANIQRQKRKAILGEGQFGVVYRGVCRGTSVAIKELKMFEKIEIERLKNEARLMSTLNHPNIIMFIGASFSDEFGAKLVVQYAANGSLEGVLHPTKSEARKLGIRRKLIIMQEIISAMDYLHNFTQPILHLDLKPANILFDEDYKIKIADFGISQILKPSGEGKTSVVGTPGYMAPEILRREEFSDKADVFSFGVIIYELWSEKYPYPDHLPSGANIFSFYESEVRAGNPVAPVLEEGIPQVLELLEMTTLDDPSERPTFRELSELNLTRTAIDELTGTGKFYQDLWLSIAPDLETSVTWKTFLPAFIKSCDLPLDYSMETKTRNFELDCLYHALGKETVTPGAFFFFVKFFSNIGTLPDDAPKILDFLKNLYLEKWWFGFITADDAKEMLISSNVKNPFLVRGSGRFPNAFVISMKKKRKGGYDVQHLGPYDCQQLSNIRSIVREIKKKKKVQPLPLHPGSLMSGNPHRSKYVTDELILTSLPDVTPGIRH